MLFELPTLADRTLVQVNIESYTADRPQGIRIKVRSGDVDIVGQRLDDVVLWTDTAPATTTATVHATAANPTVVRVWNVWRDKLGTMQAWIGDAGMLIEPTDAGTMLRCSDGLGRPSFDDLVVRIRIGNADDANRSSVGLR
jgi:hypothetical protein